MSGTDSKPRFGNGVIARTRFRGGGAIRLGSGLLQGSKSKGPAPGLEDVMYQVFTSPGKMLTQWRTNEDRVSQYAGKNFGGLGGPMAAQTIRL